MSDDDKLRSHSDPLGHAMTFTYNAHGQSPPHQSAVTVFDARGNPVSPSASPPAAMPPAAHPTQPLLRHCFELRVSGSETREEALPWPGSWPDNSVLTIERVRAFLTHDGQAVAPPAAIGGLEVHAELQPDRILCTAELTDFPAGELVVVQVDVAVYALNGR